MAEGVIGTLAGGRRRPFIRDRDTALYLGVALWVAGAVLLYDAWENRGKSRPLGVRIAGAVL